MLLGQAWAIDKLFSSKPVAETELEWFIRTGGAREAAELREPHSAAIDEKVAEILRTGKVIVR